MVYILNQIIKITFDFSDLKKRNIKTIWQTPYPWFNCRNNKGEIHRCCCSWYRLPASGYAPAHTKSVAMIKGKDVLPKKVNTVLPAIFIYPGLGKKYITCYKNIK